MKPILIVLRGPCGGGKTTVARELGGRVDDLRYIEVDAVKRDVSSSTSSNNCAEIALWFCETNKRIKEGLKNGQVVVVDEAFAEPYLFKIAMLGLEDQVNIFIVELFYPLEVHVQRYSQKTDKVHPNEETIRSHYGYYQNGRIFPKGNSDFKIANDLSITDPEQSASQIADQILRLINEKTEIELDREMEQA